MEIMLQRFRINATNVTDTQSWKIVNESNFLMDDSDTLKRDFRAIAHLKNGLKWKSSFAKAG